MDISVIIVNYNVKYFLEQCLYAVQKAAAGLQVEVLVVDNCSVDDSVAYLQQHFSAVKIIANTQNLGFGKANNRALALAKGKYVLFLNPDTIVPENCFINCIHFFESTPHCGAIGVKMVDGKGIFLPESKRAFPSVLTSFFKLSGLARIFKKSALFNRYALGNLSEHENHEIDVIAGAFMMVKKEVLDKVGGFDEAFFMYGEDVDLSYRIQQAGYKNYYFAGTTIIHFKGESAKRGSLNYVKMFYEAMSVFVKKHYSSGSAALFAVFIQLAIWVRAFITLLQSFLNRWGIAFTDALVVFSTFWTVKILWVQYIREGGDFYYDILMAVIPFFTLLFVLTGFLSGMYDNLYKPLKAFVSSAIAVVVLLAAYSLLPESYRFSRGVILMGALASAIAITVLRWLLLKLKLIEYSDTEEQRYKQTIVVGNEGEFAQVNYIMQQAGLEERILGRISTQENTPNTIGTYHQLKHLLEHINVREVIFCLGELQSTQVIALLVQLPKHIHYRFFANNSISIVGSDSKATSGETLTAAGYFLITSAYQKRMKRLADIFIALFFLITTPFHLFFQRNSITFFTNIVQVLIGKKTWIGYIKDNSLLPALPQSIITHYGLPQNIKHPLQESSIDKLDIVYARYYNWLTDVYLPFKYYKKLC